MLWIELILILLLKSIIIDYSNYTCIRHHVFFLLLQILKGWRYDAAADWWSFGVLVYEMLIGQVR